MAIERNTCPVCGYPELEVPAYDSYGCSSQDICPCCGIQFGYDDARTSHEELRRRWLSQGAPWFSAATLPPPNWSATRQLADAGLPIPSVEAEPE
jgi:hypothetical protein